MLRKVLEDDLFHWSSCRIWADIFNSIKFWQMYPQLKQVLDLRRPGVSNFGNITSATWFDLIDTLPWKLQIMVRGELGALVELKFGVGRDVLVNHTGMTVSL